ncbi:DUF4355 domain-containing protein [Halobacillus fulvus]|nr:DUF4355 domain-containing protein [Halobacillus fulvus]
MPKTCLWTRTMGCEVYPIVFKGERRMTMFKKVTYPEKLLKLNLQHFAEGGEGEGDGEGQGDGEETKFELTEEELQKKIESESDRKMAKALEKQKKEMRAELEKELKEQKAEAERLAKLSAKEREEAEFKKRQDALEKREQELAQKELKAQAVTELQDKQLPSAFAEFLIAENGDKTFENINAFKEAFDTAVNDAVKEKLRQDPPEGGQSFKQRSESNKSLAEMAKKSRII